MGNCCCVEEYQVEGAEGVESTYDTNKKYQNLPTYYQGHIMILKSE
jgi:hypothetical protein